MQWSNKELKECVNKTESTNQSRLILFHFLTILWVTLVDKLYIFI